MGGGGGGSITRNLHIPNGFSDGSEERVPVPRVGYRARFLRFVSFRFSLAGSGSSFRFLTDGKGLGFRALGFLGFRALGF